MEILELEEFENKTNSKCFEGIIKCAIYLR